MNDFDTEQFEAELRKLRPAQAPEPLMQRLNQALQTPSAESERAAVGTGTARLAREDRARAISRRGPSRWLWWLAPLGATAVAGVVLFLGVSHQPVVSPAPFGTTLAQSSKPALKADRVDVDSKLVSTFDAVASLPDGEPVRYRCRAWKDEMTVHDSARGVVIEHQTPRLEIVPVRFETY